MVVLFYLCLHNLNVFDSFTEPLARYSEIASRSVSRLEESELFKFLNTVVINFVIKTVLLFNPFNELWL